MDRGGPRPCPAKPQGFAGLGMDMPPLHGQPRDNHKTRVSILLDNDLIAALKAQGEKGWQTRANEMLRKALLEGPG